MELVLNLLNDNNKKLLHTIAVLNTQNFSKKFAEHSFSEQWLYSRKDYSTFPNLG